jgi:membrane-bound serine protease (ClpP class)
MQGVSVTMLRPAGIADFSGEKVDVLTDGDFIPADTPIEVIRTAGVRVFVKRMGNE